MRAGQWIGLFNRQARRFIRWTVVVLSALAPAGCVDPERLDEPASRQQPITSAGLDSDNVGTVALLAGGEIICSGALLSPRVVATAGHCIGGVERVFVGQSLLAGGVALDVVHQETHVAYSSQTYTADVGWLVLGQDAPASAAPYRLSVEPAETLVGSAVRVIGFGLASAHDDGARARRQGQSVVTSVDADKLTLTAAPSLTCLGDSGGPTLAIVDGVESLVGIHSSGDRACETFGRDTRVDAYASDLLSAVGVASGACDELDCGWDREIELAGGCAIGDAVARDRGTWLAVVALALVIGLRSRGTLGANDRA